jgi:AcrR family transcriptional regulator
MEEKTTPMKESATPNLSGRRAEAARNNQRILDAARAVFTADPTAPIAAVAEHAGVGIGALYRRYRSKDELLQRLALDGMRRYIAEAEAALADDGDPWLAFDRFMHRCVDAGSGAITARFAGHFIVTDELHREGHRAFDVTRHLLDRTKAAGALRPEIEPGDVSLLFEQLHAINVGDAHRTNQLRHRYLTLLLYGLHTASAASLPGPAPTWQEISGRYNG